jgi:hypothetical protein
MRPAVPAGTRRVVICLPSVETLGYFRACVDFGIDLLERFLVLASRREVLFDLLVPDELVAARNVRSQLYQILRRQLIHRFFDFRETHTQRLAAAGSISISRVEFKALFPEDLAGRFCFSVERSAFDLGRCRRHACRYSDVPFAPCGHFASFEA